MSANNYKLSEMSSADVQAVKASWKEQVEDQDIFDSELGQIFEYMEEKISSQKPDDPKFYGIKKIGMEECLAVLDVVHSKKAAGDVTKLLKVIFPPKFWVPDMTEDVAELLAVSVIQTIQAAANKGTRFTAKIYGRNDPLLEVLLTTYKGLQSKNLKELKATMEGRWLSVSNF